MTCYKAFEPGLICRGYKYRPGLNVTEKANCAANGFHCAVDPLDCLAYYPDIKKSVFCLVEALGDIDEDANDSKVSCTELKIVRQLSLKDFFLHILIYMAKHPSKNSRGKISDDRGIARNGYTIVRGRYPAGRGELGDIIALLQDDGEGNTLGLNVYVIDGENLKENTYYDIYGKEVKDRD